MNKKVVIISVSIAALALIVLVYIMISANTSKPIRDVSGKSDLLASADKSIASGDESSAVKDLKILIARSPESKQAEEAYFKLASIYEERKALIEARDAYKSIIEKFPASNNVSKAQALLDNINIKILFSNIITADSALYEIKKGDSLTKIAKLFNTTIDLIMRSNNLSDKNIKFGKSIKVPKTKFSIVVDKSQNVLILKSDNEIIKTYQVSTGKDSSTPAGNFLIINKIIDPTWYTAGAAVPSGSPGNILGTRWMGISKQGYGIHGTTEPQAIGQSVTSGCVRMRNEEVEELYTIVPIGTEVVIVE